MPKQIEALEHVAIWIPHDLIEDLKREATERGVTLNQLVVFWLENAKQERQIDQGRNGKLPRV